MTVYKLAAVGILVFLGVSACRASKMLALGPSVWLLVSLAVLAFVAMIASGGVLSVVDSPPAAVSILRKVVPYVTVLLTAVVSFCLI